MFFTFIGTTFIGYGFLLITVAELAKLVMDLQDNTYQSTELNLSMAESLRVIEDNIKSIAEKIKKD